MSELHLRLDEPLSPELALVCPELAERARRTLPDPGWLAPIPAPPPAPPQAGRLQLTLVTLFCLLVTITPLVFVGLMMKLHAVHR